jgi:hypothetical protein
MQSTKPVTLLLAKLRAPYIGLGLRSPAATRSRKETDSRQQCGRRRFGDRADAHVVELRARRKVPDFHIQHPGITIPLKAPRAEQHSIDKALQVHCRLVGKGAKRKIQLSMVRGHSAHVKSRSGGGSSIVEELRSPIVTKEDAEIRRGIGHAECRIKSIDANAVGDPVVRRVVRGRPVELDAKSAIGEDLTSPYAKRKIPKVPEIIRVVESHAAVIETRKKKIQPVTRDGVLNPAGAQHQIGRQQSSVTPSLIRPVQAPRVWNVEVIRKEGRSWTNCSGKSPKGQSDSDTEYTWRTYVHGRESC